MSFLVKMGEVEKDHRLAMVRKKYFHSILQFNQNLQRDKKEASSIEKQQTNQKFSRVNQSALESLQTQLAAKQQEKFVKQEALKVEYQRQIRQRRDKLAREREGDRKYLQLQLIETDRASERRVADLMKIYDRAAVNFTHRRLRTEPDDNHSINPEGKQQKQTSNQSFKRMPFLPAIDRIQATAQMKHKQYEENTQRTMNQSHRSLSAYNRD